MVLSLTMELDKKSAKETVEDAHESLGLNYTDLATALGVDRRSVLRYRNLRTVPSRRVQERLERVREIAHLLDEVFEGQDAQLYWLHTAVPLLAGRRPIDLVRRGELDEVLSVLAGLYSGASS